MNQLYIQRPQNLAPECATDEYRREDPSGTVCSPNIAMQVPMPTSRNEQGRAADYPSSPDAMIQVSSQVFNVQKLVKSHYEDRIMQHSNIQQERDELVGVEPWSLTRFHYEDRFMQHSDIQQERDELVGVRVEPWSHTRFSEFEGTIYGMQVEFDTV